MDRVQTRMHPLWPLLFLASLAAASEPTLRVEVDPAVALRLDVASVVGEVAEELEMRVTLEGDAPARVTVRAEGPEDIAIVYERDDGTRRERMVRLPSERAESTRIVVLLVSNLARDQVSTPLPPGEPAEEAAPVERAVQRPVRVPRTAAERRFHLGLGAVAGAATVDGAAAPFYLWGAEVGWRHGDHVGLGLAHVNVSVGYGPEDGAIFVFDGTPYVEVAGFATSRLMPYGRVGLLVQAHSRSFHRPEGWFEAAPYVGGGARFFVTRSFAVGIEVGAHVVVTDELNLGAATLTRGSVPGSLGLSTTFNF